MGRSSGWAVRPWGSRLVAFLTSLLLSSGAAAEIRGNANLFLGAKMMSDQWQPAGQQFEIGATVDFRSEQWPVSAAVALLYTKADESESTFGVKDEIFEYHFGVLKLWHDDDLRAKFRPFVGGGAVVAQANVALSRIGLSTVHDQDLGFGGWVGAGFYWNPYRSLNLGVDARWSTASVQLMGQDFDAGGVHLGVTVGWRWMSF